MHGGKTGAARRPQVAKTVSYFRFRRPIPRNGSQKLRPTRGTDITMVFRATTEPCPEDQLSYPDFDHSQFHRPLRSIGQSGASSNPVVERFLAKSFEVG